MSVTRRTFLRTTGTALGLAALGQIGWQFRPVTAADGTQDQALKSGQAPALLVVYGSMMGSTGGQAAWIAERAQAAGYRVALHAAETAPSPEGFDRVMIGSAIRAAAWLDPVVAWSARHAEAIAARPFALFQASMTCAGMVRGNEGAPLTEAQAAELRRDSDNLRAAAPQLAEAAVAFFPGRLEFHRLTPLLRLAPRWLLARFCAVISATGRRSRAGRARKWRCSLFLL